MAKDILLYGSIREYNALYFHQQIKDALHEDEAEDLKLRINCDGGSPEYAMSVINKVKDTPNFTEIIVEGMAHSMALYSLCYFDGDVSSIDTAQFVLHRAAYPEWLEKSTSFVDSIERESLAKTNKDLEKAFRARADVEAFENLTQVKSKNITLKDIFSMDGRVEVLLSAADMKKIGLVDNIIKVTPSKQAEISSLMKAFQNAVSPEQFKKAAQSIQQQEQNQVSTAKAMTLEELKTQHPELYTQAVNQGKSAGLTEGKTAGVNEERDRIKAWEAYRKIDADTVDKAIKEGKVITMTDIAEFHAKAIATPGALARLAAESAPDVTTQEDDTKIKTQKEAQVADFVNKVRSNLGLKNEAK